MAEWVLPLRRRIRLWLRYAPASFVLWAGAILVVHYYHMGIAVIGCVVGAVALHVTMFVRMVKENRAFQRKGDGLCVACGYDLRATPARSGPLFDRCPECGTVPANS